MIISPTPKWQFNLAYHYIDAKFSSGVYRNKHLPFIPENTFRLSGNYIPKQYWNIFFEGTFRGDCYPINDVENKAQPLGGFSTYNLGIGYEKQHYSIKFRVNNLTNKKYYAYSVVTYNNSIANPSGFFYPAPEINGAIEVSIKI